MVDLNSEIAKLFEEDQRDRLGVFEDEKRMQRMVANDKVRLMRARQIYLEHESGAAPLTPESLYFLAMLFQHNPDEPDFLNAQTLADQAAIAGYERGKWHSAAAEDRYLTHSSRKQKWGTQFRKAKDGTWEQFPMESDSDSGVTDAMRHERDIPPRSAQLERFIAKQTAWENNG